jgi:hypothetical protein
MRAASKTENANFQVSSKYSKRQKETVQPARLNAFQDCVCQCVCIDQTNSTKAYKALAHTTPSQADQTVSHLAHQRSDARARIIRDARAQPHVRQPTTE